MIKKIAIIVLGFIILITLTACPDKEQPEQQKNTEMIPNTMQKATDELEQIITLLGGPLFNGRDNIEQMKNEQMQMLLESAQKSSLGTQDKEQMQPNDGSEKDEQQQEGSRSEKQEGSQESGQNEEQKDIKDKQEEQDGEQKRRTAPVVLNLVVLKKKNRTKKVTAGRIKRTGRTGRRKENSSEKEDTQRPGVTQDKTFQYEDSLLVFRSGIRITGK